MVIIWKMYSALLGVIFSRTCWNGG
jgi:hypothetical protein